MLAVFIIAFFVLDVLKFFINFTFPFSRKIHSRTSCYDDHMCFMWPMCDLAILRISCSKEDYLQNFSVSVSDNRYGWFFIVEFLIPGF